MAKSTKLQRIARKRNWSKARIIGGLTGISRSVLSHNEKMLLDKMQALQREMLRDWDKTKPKDLLYETK